VVLYYITDRAYFADRRAFLNKISEAARCGVDYVQLREKDLSGRELESLAQSVLQTIRDEKSNTALLINSRTDVCLAVGADGVHLRSDDISARDARTILSKRKTDVGVSCHTVDEVKQAASDGANFAVFGSVFEKNGMPDAKPAGLEKLRQACQHDIPVLALGGINWKNARLCRDAGAAGIAAIRLFQEHNIADIVDRLKRI
jgi:thiamine-phosphate pyrophosphorylase